jgi:DNA-binding XRE family transcriptional regulator
MVTGDDVHAPDGEGDEPRRRGGVVKGAWKTTTPEKLLEFRKTYKVSRARLSKVLGVSATTIQNWESEADVASTKAQARLAEVMRDAAKLFPAPSRGETGAAISTTGEIVEGYLRSLGRPIDKDALLELIRNVRSALS